MATRFTKEELHQELKTALLLQARLQSWIFDSGAAYRIFGWPDESRSGSSALMDIDVLDLHEVVRQEKQSFDVTTAQVFLTFDELYDYGFFGRRRHDLEEMTPGTEFSFAYAFIVDLHQSRLINEAFDHGELFVKCLHVARLAQARAILDGGRRYFSEQEGLPDQLLTIGEVALLAEMEERSVRNSATGKSPTLKTITEDGKAYVQPEAAREWLKTRKGFVASYADGPLANLDLRSRAFASRWEVEEFVRQRCESRGISVQSFCKSLGLDAGDDSASSRWLPIWYPQGAQQIRLVSELIGVDPELFSLRLDELSLAEKAAQLRQAIEQLRSKVAA